MELYCTKLVLLCLLVKYVQARTEENDKNYFIYFTLIFCCWNKPFTWYQWQLCHCQTGLQVLFINIVSIVTARIFEKPLFLLAGLWYSTPYRQDLRFRHSIIYAVLLQQSCSSTVISEPPAAGYTVVIWEYCRQRVGTNWSWLVIASQTVSTHCRCAV